jgi:pimeloyl-ACP methyl ester carboxylesterase
MIAGILGSEIDECNADNSGCTSIWGTAEAAVRKDIDLTVKADKVYRTDVVDSLFFVNMYGNVINYIRSKALTVATDRTDDPLLTVFHYDWRLSNDINAKTLAKTICEVRAHAPNSPIVVLSHSMGGLIAKIWAEKYGATACDDGTVPHVREIVFVWTPHLGSPKAIKALADGYNLLFDDLNGLRYYLGWFERNYILTSINQSGFSFASFYELLPIRMSEYCLAKRPFLAEASDPVDGDAGKPVNLFNIEMWKRYDLLKQIEPPAAREAYYEAKIAPC